MLFQRMYKNLKERQIISNKMGIFAIGSVVSHSEKQETKFSICKRSHDLQNCHPFNKNPLLEKSNFLFDQKLCYGCLFPISENHNARNLKIRRECSNCRKRNPSCLHEYKPKVKVAHVRWRWIFTVSLWTWFLKSKVCVVPLKLPTAFTQKDMPVDNDETAAKQKLKKMEKPQ